MFNSSALRIDRIDFFPVDIAMTDDFVISSGRVDIARNIFVAVTLRNGVCGYGEIAPFTAVTGEERETSLAAAEEMARSITGTSVAQYRYISACLTKGAPEQPAARCGLETAVLDAFCRASDMPMWAFFGGAHRTGSIMTDMTIPLLSRERSAELAALWYQRGFSTLKMKVGADVQHELNTLREIAALCPAAAFVLDANAGFSETEALAFIREVTRAGINVHLYEQPVPKTDLAAMARLCERSPVPIVADEAVNTREDALAVLSHRAAHVINLKIMKSGVLQTLEIAAVARAGGLGLMIGGMVETRLAMSCSLAIALGLGGMSNVDLDTPLLMAHDPLQGGYRYEGPQMVPSALPGLAIEPKNQEPNSKSQEPRVEKL